MNWALSFPNRLGNTHIDGDEGRLPLQIKVGCVIATLLFQDFEETYRLVEEYKFPSLFINQFFPRPGTPAARMPRTCTTQEVIDYVRAGVH